MNDTHTYIYNVLDIWYVCGETAPGEPCDGSGRAGFVRTLGVGLWGEQERGENSVRRFAELSVPIQPSREGGSGLI